MNNFSNIFHNINFFSDYIIRSFFWNTTVDRTYDKKIYTFTLNLKTNQNNIIDNENFLNIISSIQAKIAYSNFKLIINNKEIDEKELYEKTKIKYDVTSQESYQLINELN